MVVGPVLQDFSVGQGSPNRKHVPKVRMALDGSSLVSASVSLAMGVCIAEPVAYQDQVEPAILDTIVRATPLSPTQTAKRSEMCVLQVISVQI